MKSRIASHSIAALAVLATVGASWGTAHARETITWYSSEFPPYTITMGPEKGKGSHEFGIKDFMARLAHYDHKQEEGNSARVVHSLGNEPSSCSLQVIKNPEREKTIAYSTLPHTWLLPNALITMRKNVEAFKPFMNEAGEIKLDEALASGKFKVGAQHGRAYGAVIDPVLQKYPNLVVPLPNNASNSLGMVMQKLASTQGEFEAGFGYAVEVTYQIKTLGLDGSSYATLPIMGSTLVPLSVACSKTESGRRILAEIDKILAEPAVQATFDARYKSWVEPAAVPYYEQMLKQARAKAK